MDLTEHILTESERFLKRLGITHFLRPPTPVSPAEERGQPTPPAAQSHCASQDPVVIPSLLRVLFHEKHIPAHSIWTYSALEDDLQEMEHHPRLALLHKIQDSATRLLRWKKERMLMWPCPEDERVFHHGIVQSQAPLVFCFGPIRYPDMQAATASNGHMTWQSATIQILPSLDAMLGGDQTSKNLAWKIIQSYAS